MLQTTASFDYVRNPGDCLSSPLQPCCDRHFRFQTLRLPACVVQKLPSFSATAVQPGEACTAKSRSSVLRYAHKFREQGYFTDSCCFLAVSTASQSRALTLLTEESELCGSRACRVQVREICSSSTFTILILLTFSMVGCHKLQNQENLHMHSNYFFRLFHQIKD